ncbi:MAG: hypothetical protein E5X43_18700 [Mesorhizobium sp.]|uniref:hypothetical protein n=1 Tax=Mesorhizobium sp. TaxID=1871066 RepID=UPI000FE7E67F|nr:hypothetical protein [Mesorhizobium sp.]RWH81319.1 MAG: hypothetical protein EOQ85_09855 [Mesorhizobium sp.]RWH85708.1 MAG: hypothetical protein EOQ86_05935 [Mesorhizobium sp.]RWH90965.1 MAG: hypothetical protein EOQ87_09590 [Mesorhizobium sp.]RWH99647.1 MAG: hypothetical protein EOQ88_09695 [Mesorhizobium sp.]RWI04111.1 MAG: hypothetical protein EOQ89_11215 [Mesorhizobium sp.]
MPEYPQLGAFVVPNKPSIKRRRSGSVSCASKTWKWLILAFAMKQSAIYLLPGPDAGEEFTL